MLVCWPRIEELLDNLGGNQFYSVMDMKSGYYQVGVQEEHKPYTAFTSVHSDCMSTTVSPLDYPTPKQLIDFGGGVFERY